MQRRSQFTVFDMLDELGYKALIESVCSAILDGFWIQSNILIVVSDNLDGFR